MPHGQITRLEPRYGFGWLVDDAGLDWFFVGAGVRGGAIERLTPDERVVFASEWTPSGPRATDIRSEWPQQQSE